MEKMSNMGVRAAKWLFKGERAWVAAEWVGVAMLAVLAGSWAIGTWSAEGASLGLEQCSGRHASPKMGVGGNFLCALGDMAKEASSGPSDFPAVDFYRRR
jgi:hypothetical protein